MNRRMVWKLTACFAAVLLLFTAVLGTVFVSLFRQHITDINRVSLEKKAISIAETLSSFNMESNGRGTGGRGMGGGGLGGYGAYLRFLDQLAMAEVWIVDENLNMMTAGHGRSASYSQLPENAEQIVKRVFNGEITYGEDFSSLLDTPSLTVGAPIISGDDIVGAVLLHSPISGVDDAVRQGLSVLIWSAVVALALAGGTAVWLSYRFTNPLSRMRTTALELSNGNYAAQTGVTQIDEIGQLAQTIDSLANRLAFAEQERETLDQLKQDFVANVSHELRTPVAVLRGSLEVLRDGTVHTPEEVSDYYDQMLAESRHLERLVNDLLDLSRLQDALFQLDFEHINLCDVVRDAARAVRRLSQEKELELLVDCPQEECILSGDYGRIRQLLLILLDNAIKFSKEHGTVEITLKKEINSCLLSVSNQGKEIPPEVLPRLFDRFYKVESGQNRTGTGLGLAIAKQIADRHQAVIFAESEGGQTTFFVRLGIECA